MATIDGDRRRQRIALVVFGVLLLALIAAVAVPYAMRGSTPTASEPAASEPAAVAEPPVAEVLLVPISTPQDDFTPPMGEDVELVAVAPQDATTATDVSAAQVGLYGGTLDQASCDRDQLADYLDTHPAKAREWGEVREVAPTEIRAYLDRLTPVVLRTDTLVTNHGFVDGAATSFPSVLQAGSAVLVDDYGLPVVRCYCGNPLTEAPTVSQETTYSGKAWKGFSAENVVRVKKSDGLLDGFELIDTETGDLFTRPVGTAGQQDAPSDAGPSAVTAPEASPTPTSGDTAATSDERPVGEPVTLFEVTSIAGVSSDPPKPVIFQLDTDAYLTQVVTYHYLNQGTGPGTIALESDDGTVFGPWQAVGSEGQGGVPDAYWTATPNVRVPAGTYRVVDSNPSTWSWAFDTEQRGITIITGIPYPVTGQSSTGMG
jgi:hypothetical protein